MRLGEALRRLNRASFVYIGSGTTFIGLGAVTKPVAECTASFLTTASFCAFLTTHNIFERILGVNRTLPNVAASSISSWALSVFPVVQILIAIIASFGSGDATRTNKLLQAVSKKFDAQTNSPTAFAYARIGFRNSVCGNLGSLVMFRFFATR